jgi:hypothetical protein
MLGIELGLVLGSVLGSGLGLRLSKFAGATVSPVPGPALMLVGTAGEVDPPPHAGNSKTAAATTLARVKLIMNIQPLHGVTKCGAQSASRVNRKCFYLFQ